jgi:hypothetical protein
VEVVRQPFQQFVSASTTGASEQCEDVVLPDGKRLVVESFSAKANSASRPDVYLRMTAAFPGGSFSFRRTLQVPLSAHLVVDWAGAVTTLLHTGQTSDSTNASFSYRACIFGASGTAASFSGLVSGWLE